MVYGINHDESGIAMSQSDERLHSYDTNSSIREKDDSDNTRLKTMAGINGQFDDCDDTPREVDLLTEEHVEDLLDAVECLQSKVEQLQIHCEKLAYEKGRLEDQLIQSESESLEKTCNFEKELSSSRKINLQLLANANDDNGDREMPPWAKTSLDAEKALEDQMEAEAQVKLLQITLLDKDKQISSLEWQLMDTESTVSSIQAERDRLAVELDCLLAREEEELEAYRDSFEDKVVFSDDEYEQPYDMSCPLKKHTRRHLSDLTQTQDSHNNDLTEFMHKGKRVAALSDNDRPSAADAQFLGGLKRTTNFDNINNVDEFTDFHQDEGVGDSYSVGLCASFPAMKLKTHANSSWQSFGSDSEGGMSPSKSFATTEINKSDSWVPSDFTRNDSRHSRKTSGKLIEGCFDDAHDWSLDADATPVGALSGYKNESCRSSSSAYFSDNSTNEMCHDLWTFTPDSIIDVSTGEELKATDAESLTPPDEDTEEPPKHDTVNDTPKEQKRITTINVPLSANFERTSSVKSDSAVNSSPKDNINHQRINSEPLPQSPSKEFSDDKGIVKLEAYQKWRLSGRKGQPPAKLKISQC